MTYATKCEHLSSTNVADCATVACLAAFTFIDVDGISCSLVITFDSEHGIEECRNRWVSLVPRHVRVCDRLIRETMTWRLALEME